MSVGRLNKMEQIIRKGSIENGFVIYPKSKISELMRLIGEEKSIQDRKTYASAYYVKHKQQMDERAKAYYEEHKNEIRERRNKKVD